MADGDPRNRRRRGAGIRAFGNVLAAYVGSVTLDRGGTPAYFSTFALAMALVFLSLAIVRGHIRSPARSRR